MKKYLATLCAAMLCVCCLALAACGGSASSASSAATSDASTSASASASTSASAAAASSSSAASAASETTIDGTWKLAAAETQGITICGDFSMLFGSAEGMTFVLNADGTGSTTLGEDTSEITWTSTGDNTLDLVGTGQTVPATIENGALKMTISTDSADVVAIFTKDGTYADAKVIDATSSKPITSMDAATGEWQLCGIKMMGVTMYGDPADLAAAMSIPDTTLKISADGTASAIGDSATCTVDGSGAKLSISGVDMPLSMLGDNIALDATNLMGSEMIMVFSK